MSTAAHDNLTRTVEQLEALTSVVARLAAARELETEALAFLAADLAGTLPGLIAAARVEALGHKEVQR